MILGKSLFGSKLNLITIYILLLFQAFWESIQFGLKKPCLNPAEKKRETVPQVKVHTPIGEVLFNKDLEVAEKMNQIKEIVENVRMFIGIKNKDEYDRICTLLDTQVFLNFILKN